MFKLLAKLFSKSNKDTVTKPSGPKIYKTFADMGVSFLPGSGCITCMNHSCSNTVHLRGTEEEVNVHISTNKNRTLFRIHATAQSSTTSNDELFKETNKESEAVAFVCEKFTWFTCF